MIGRNNYYNWGECEGTDLYLRYNFGDVKDDMSYEFITKDNYKFTATLAVGVDFFFPRT